MADPEDRSFDPSTPEANRARQQGLGVGQRELEAQGDPTLAEGRQGHRLPHAMDPLAETDSDPIDDAAQGSTVTSPEGDDPPGAPDLDR